MYIYLYSNGIRNKGHIVLVSPSEERETKSYNQRSEGVRKDSAFAKKLHKLNSAQPDLYDICFAPQPRETLELDLFNSVGVGVQHFVQLIS
jgi:hypothetical protein